MKRRFAAAELTYSARRDHNGTHTPMAARRHLPVLQNAPSPAPATPASEADEAPPWHWIPLGSVVSVLAYALLAQGAVALSVKLLATVYPPHATAAQIASIRASNRGAALTELAAGMVPVAALLASVGLGGYFIGRYGARTNARHGTLSGLVTAALFWLVTGRLTAMLLMVPLAMAAGWGAARAGTWVRDRDAG